MTWNVIKFNDRSIIISRLNCRGKVKVGTVFFCQKSIAMDVAITFGNLTDDIVLGWVKETLKSPKNLCTEVELLEQARAAVASVRFFAFL